MHCALLSGILSQEVSVKLWRAARGPVPTSGGAGAVVRSVNTEPQVSDAGLTNILCTFHASYIGQKIKHGMFYCLKKQIGKCYISGEIIRAGSNSLVARLLN